MDLKNQKAAILQQLPPIATKYILTGFFCAWKNGEFGIIKNLIGPVTRLPISNEQVVI